MNISPTGCWLCETKEPHGYDEPLAAEIFLFLFNHEINHVLDFGCGSGAYVDCLRSKGINAVGFDGNPNTHSFSKACFVADLTEPVDAIKVGCVLSLETGEHIPREFEEMFLSNLVIHAEKYLILSWFPRPGEGIGHVNERSNEYVINKLSTLGFLHLPTVTERLRKAATLWWFKESLMAFERGNV